MRRAILGAVLLCTLTTAARAQVIPGSTGRNARSELDAYRAQVNQQAMDFIQSWGALWQKRDTSHLAEMYLPSSRAELTGVRDATGSFEIPYQLINSRFAGQHVEFAFDDFYTSGDMAYVSSDVTIAKGLPGGHGETTDGRAIFILLRDSHDKWHIRAQWLTMDSTKVLAPPPVTDNLELQRLDAQVFAVTSKSPVDLVAYRKVQTQSRTRASSILTDDGVVTAHDFVLASKLAADASGFFEFRRVEHELALAALALDPVTAMDRLNATWDGLNLSFGRGQRIGVFMPDGTPIEMDAAATPAPVRFVFKNLADARGRASKGSDNAELRIIRDADQADRAEPIDAAKLASMRANDPMRRARVLQLISADSLVTGHDFGEAALVLEHGTRFNDFALAHELSIAAVALGDTSSTWLLPRTYDRLLLALGHRQRFGTQTNESGTAPVDSTGLYDRERSLLHAPVAGAKPNAISGTALIR